MMESFSPSTIVKGVFALVFFLAFLRPLRTRRVVVPMFGGVYYSSNPILYMALVAMYFCAFASGAWSVILDIVHIIQPRT